MHWEMVRLLRLDYIQFYACDSNTFSETAQLQEELQKVLQRREVQCDFVINGIRWKLRINTKKIKSDVFCAYWQIYYGMQI